MKATNRLYINITNKCNINCPFCCMNSGTNKNTFMNFNVFKSIIDSSNNDIIEVQIEGGEPLLHNNLYLFLEYLNSINRCVKITINTNGILLLKHIERLIIFNKYSNLFLTIKRSINYYLYEILGESLFTECRDLYLSTEFIDKFKLIFNVRIKKEDSLILNKIKEYKLLDQCNIFELQRYGKFKNEVEYNEPYINQNIDDWNIYSCDGKLFNKDLIGRSLYEGDLK